MTDDENNLMIQIKYKDIEKTFSGQVDDVWISVNRFFCDLIPTFNIAKDIFLTADLPHLIRDCKDLIAFTKDSPYLVVSRDKLTDNETLALQLLAGYIGYRLGVLESDLLSREELQSKLGKNSKITSTRISELVRSEIAKKTSNGKYMITAFGINQMQKEILPRIKEKRII